MSEKTRTNIGFKTDAQVEVKTVGKPANTFEPKIVGLLCNWCSYTGADLAGISRKKYAPNVRIIRVMCSGRVEPAFILKAFQSGADGVLVLGCHPGDCHYIEGNYKTMRRMPLLKKLLSQMGIEEERLRLEWVSASEGDRFASIVNEMTEQIRKLGPFSNGKGGPHAQA
jgi:F420-non-reducing hydrogenase iron-sulfur subunit